MSRLSRVFSELKRRNVFRTSAAYIVLAWLVIQAADILLDTFAAPDWMMRTLVVALALGFVAAVFLSWVYEITTQGVKRTEEVSPGDSITDTTGRKIDFIIIGVLAVAVAVFALDRFAWQQFEDDQVADQDIPSIAILPYGLESDEVAPFFVELSSDLSRMLQRSGQIRLASSDAVDAIPNDANVGQIAARLGVRYVLVGALEITENDIALSVALFDSEIADEIWTESFRNAQLQETTNAVANMVLAEVGGDPLFVNTTPSDPRAYDLYLQATQYHHSTFLSEDAERLYREAIDVDSRFAPAYAGLCSLFTARYGWMSSTQDFEEAERHCLRAWTIDEHSTEAQLSLGMLYLESGQIKKAREMLAKVLTTSEQNYDAQSALAETYHEDNPDLAETMLRRLIQQNPSSPNAYMSLQYLYWKQGRYVEAVEQQRWAVRLLPDDEGAKIRLSADLMLAGMFDEAKSLLLTMLESDSLKTASIENNLGVVLFFEGDYAGAAKLFRAAIDREPEDSMYYRALGDAIWHLDGKGAAESLFRTTIDLAERQLDINPDDYFTVSNLMVAYGSVGDLDRFQSSKDTVLELMATDPQVYYDIAVAASRLNDMEMARIHARKARELGYPVALLRADPDIAASGISFD